jgi:glutamate-5-semialdehyde dehydrogenase
VHRDIAKRLLPPVIDQLESKKVQIRLDEQAMSFSNNGSCKAASESDWRTEYCDLILSIKVVDCLDEAVEHINKYGSKHTEVVVTEDQEAFDLFFAKVDAAGVYLNASTRFADGFRYGFGAEVGISTGKLHPRGPVGVEGLLTYKYKLIGDGHISEDYQPGGKSTFIHQKINSDDG